MFGPPIGTGTETGKSGTGTETSLPWLEPGLEKSGMTGTRPDPTGTGTKSFNKLKKYIQVDQKY